MLLFYCCSNDDDSSSLSPRRNINEYAYLIKIILPNALIGAVMGRSGAHVAHIKEATGAFIQATKPSSATFSPRDRLVIIAGPDARSCKTALRILLETLQSQGVVEKLSRIGHPSRLFLRQIIPAACAGKILGPGGDQIAAIGAVSGANVVIEAKPSNAAFIPFRFINYMASDVYSLAAATGAVADLLEEDDKYTELMRTITSVAFKIVQIPEKRAGSLLGPGGAHIKTLQEVLRVKMGICEGTRPGSRYVAVHGSPSNVNVALDVIALVTGGDVRGSALRSREEANKPTYASEESDVDLPSSDNGSIAEGD